MENGQKIGETTSPTMTTKRQVLGIRVSSDSHKGGRDYMEDMVSIRFERRKDNDIAFFGVFDGHGGREAAVFARDMLWDTIKTQRGFESKDPDKVSQAIKEGFLRTQDAMWKKRSTWGRTKSGYPSTAGTTACIAIVRGRHMWVAHVGDSRAVLGVSTHSATRGLKARTVTIDHKPESPKEVKRIEAIGGKVQAKNGVQRVVWERTKLSHTGPVRRSTCVDQIPFLAVARSLGDLWSYSTLHDDYVVSPYPDVSHQVLNPKVHRVLVLGSDGLWNMLSSSESIYIISMYNYEKYCKGEKMRETISQRLVKNAINRWVNRSLRADNTTAITVKFDFPSEKRKPWQTSGDTEMESSLASPTEELGTPSTSNMVYSPTTSSPEIPKDTTPDGKVTSPEAVPEDEGTMLRIKGETDFLGLQGFGTFRPKLRRTNAYRDFTFRFWYPEEEEEEDNPRMTAKEFWERENRKCKAPPSDSEEELDDESWKRREEESLKRRIEPNGDCYINFPYRQAIEGQALKPQKRTSYPSPWLSPPEVEEKCFCFECRHDYTEFCTEIYVPKKKKRAESSWNDPTVTPSSDGQGSSTYATSNGYVKPKVAKKTASPVKQKIYNTRNSPTEPEVPLAQRALRSLNKSASQSPKVKNSFSPKKKILSTPTKRTRNGRLRSTRLLKTC